MEDAEVMEQVRDGCVERLALLFERHHVHLYNFFLRLTGQRGVSEDLVQEVFLRLLRYRSSYRVGSPFGPWLWGIARNVYHDQQRLNRPQPSLEEVPGGLPDLTEGPEARLIRDQEVLRLQQAMTRLAPAKRELLLLSRSPDLAYTDLAAMMACSVASVKVQVHRALKELKGIFFAMQGGLS